MLNYIFLNFQIFDNNLTSLSYLFYQLRSQIYCLFESEHQTWKYLKWNVFDAIQFPKDRPIPVQNPAYKHQLIDRSQRPLRLRPSQPVPLALPLRLSRIFAVLGSSLGLLWQQEKSIFGCDLYLHTRISYWLLFICLCVRLLSLRLLYVWAQAMAMAKAFNELANSETLRLKTLRQESPDNRWQTFSLLSAAFVFGVCRELSAGWSMVQWRNNGEGLYWILSSFR